MTGQTEKKMTDHNIPLSSAEIANLWGAYMGNTMSVCFLKYFVKQVEDTQIKEVVEYALSLAEKHVQRTKDIMLHEKFPIPVGFTEEDVDIEAPRLYSDVFILNYIHQTTKSGFSLYTIALPNIARSDVLDFFSECIVSLTELYKRVAHTSLSKGTFIRPPQMDIPEKIEFIQNQHFLAGFFGDKRAINALEITHMFSNIQSNYLGRALITGFAQVAQADDVRAYMAQGIKVANEHIETLGNMLVKEDLPVPSSWDDLVTGSTSSPFSDKIMLFHISGLNALSIFNYGAALSGSQRHDIHVVYGRLLAQLGIYAEAGARLMIANKYMEQTPLSQDRDLLIKR